MLFQVTFGEQNTEKEAHKMLSYSVDHGINIIDAAEVASPLLNFVTFTLTDIFLTESFGIFPAARKLSILFSPLIFLPLRVVVLRENNFSTLTLLPGNLILLITTAVYHTSASI
ncbi:hypothetical protein OIU74_022728 [Salix koriyanagi]|uniref:Uncharacterized protein n=1 Tax=Salix koriyanagi TaxID=2511006 RepID=A0A9Q0WP05_9ROSI|nr:hypothetical protein OIU74_022728 [Salix koriyanagi]